MRWMRKCRNATWPWSKRPRKRWLPSTPNLKTMDQLKRTAVDHLNLSRDRLCSNQGKVQQDFLGQEVLIRVQAMLVKEPM